MSKCQLCGCNDSHIDITLLVKDDTVMLSVCPCCAETYSIDAHSLEKHTLTSFIKRGLAMGQRDADDSEESSIKMCPNCGISGEEVIDTSQVGCPFCYFTFSHLPCVQDRATSSRSFLPGETLDASHEVQESLEVLQRRLDNAIANEHFERAAEIRDQINARNKDGN